MDMIQVIIGQPRTENVQTNILAQSLALGRPFSTHLTHMNTKLPVDQYATTGPTGEVEESCGFGHRQSRYIADVRMRRDSSCSLSVEVSVLRGSDVYCQRSCSTGEGAKLLERP